MYKRQRKAEFTRENVIFVVSSYTDIDETFGLFSVKDVQEVNAALSLLSPVLSCLLPLLQYAVVFYSIMIQRIS